MQQVFCQRKNLDKFLSSRVLGYILLPPTRAVAGAAGAAAGVAAWLLAPNEDTLFGIPMELYWLPKQPPAKGAPPAAGPYQLGCLDPGRGHLATHKIHI
jgi:hypothetical protein